MSFKSLYNKYKIKQRKERTQSIALLRGFIYIEYNDMLLIAKPTGRYYLQDHNDHLCVKMVEVILLQTQERMYVAEDHQVKPLTY